MSNWRRDIRASSEPSLLVHRPKTPEILRTLNNRTRSLKKKHFYQDELEWIRFYNKSVDEYHKIEGEINGLDLEQTLHSQIKQHRKEYSQWIKAQTVILSKCISSGSDESIDEAKTMFSGNMYVIYL